MVVGALQRMAFSLDAPYLVFDRLVYGDAILPAGVGQDLIIRRVCRIYEFTGYSIREVHKSPFVMNSTHCAVTASGSAL